MPAFIPLIAAVIGAGATIYATEASRGKGAKAPAFGGSEKSKGFEMPDVFGSKAGGSSMLGGQGGQKPIASLSQSLAGGTTPPPQFGQPAGPNFLENEAMREQLKKLMSQGG